MKIEKNHIKSETVAAQGTVVCLITTRGEELLVLNIFIYSLWHQGKRIASKESAEIGVMKVEMA